MKINILTKHDDWLQPYVTLRDPFRFTRSGRMQILANGRADHHTEPGRRSSSSM